MQRQAVQECIAEFLSLSQTIVGKQSYREKVFFPTQKWMFYRKSSMAPAHTQRQTLHINWVELSMIFDLDRVSQKTLCCFDAWMRHMVCDFMWFHRNNMSQ